MSPKRRARRHRHHEWQWALAYAEQKRLGRLSGGKGIEWLDLPVRLAARREACIERACRLNRTAEPFIVPGYGLCPKTGTFHRFEVWDQASGCRDCGWEDWTTSRLADGREYGCMCCHGVHGGPESERSIIDDFPYLTWDPITARRLMALLPAHRRIAPTQRMDRRAASISPGPMDACGTPTGEQ